MDVPNPGDAPSAALQDRSWTARIPPQATHPHRYKPDQRGWR